MPIEPPNPGKLLDALRAISADARILRDMARRDPNLSNLVSFLEQAEIEFSTYIQNHPQK